MTLTFAAVADIHVGPPFYFGGKLRKMGEAAEALTRGFVQRMNQVVHPDLVLVLGDLIQDDSPNVDLERYQNCLHYLSELQAPCRHVVGNHDTINLSDDTIREALGHQGPLFYGFDFGGFHFSVLRTIEEPQVVVRVDPEQVDWLREDLAKTKLPTIVAMHHTVADQDLRGNPWFEHYPHIALVREREVIRRVIAESGKVRLVLNGHLHWNHVDIHDGIPYVTLQSLTENIEDDAPGRPAAAWATVHLDDRGLLVTVEGEALWRFQHHV